MAPWGFYGRSRESEQLSQILDRRRWFFVSITGRRRIGKTTLVEQTVKSRPDRPVFYVQIPDSEEAGVVSTVNDALDAFQIPTNIAARPHSLLEFVKLIEILVRAGYIVVLDEFQYFSRKRFAGFCSLLQAMVDRLNSIGTGQKLVLGGLIVLGSIYTEMMALLEDRSAPLYARTTDKFDLPHLDIAAVCNLIKDHADFSPDRLLFLWNLFEGVPKFYRDCYERQVLNADRPTLLRKIFFESASPLRTEAENWFLHELQGRYDTVLKFVARNPGRLHGDLVDAVRQAGGRKTDDQIGGYLQVLIDRYRLIEKKLPVFAAEKSRKGRYYLSDNFLQTWLGVLANPVAARNFRSLDQLVATAVDNLNNVEGFAFERLVSQLYEERSRKGLEGFPLQAKIGGYWNRGDVEIDLVAVNEDDRRIRFGSCKRSSGRLVEDVNNFRGHVSRFLEAFPKYKSWGIEHVGIAPVVDNEVRSTLRHYGVLAEDLVDLTRDLA